MSCMQINPLSVILFANIFSSSVSCLLFTVPFAVQKLLSLIRSHLFISVPWWLTTTSAYVVTVIAGTFKREENLSLPFLCPQSWAPLVTHTVKNLSVTQETQVRSLGSEDPLEKGMATHSSIPAWKIPWTEEPGGLQFVGPQRVGHDWVTGHTHSTHLLCELCYTKT